MKVSPMSFKPLLGLLHGLALYIVLNHITLSTPIIYFVIVLFSLPLLWLQIKPVTSHQSLLSFLVLGIAALLYAYGAYGLANIAFDSDNNFFWITVQYFLSSFIIFIFYVVFFVDKTSFSIPRFAYPGLFKESWLAWCKIKLGILLTFLTYTLFMLAGTLFEYLQMPALARYVADIRFVEIVFPLIFGISMHLLSYKEDILMRLVQVFLSFCKFLYPILIIISLSFLIALPFSSASLADFWGTIITLSVLNLVLFNGVFQDGNLSLPYPSFFQYVIYLNFILLTICLTYILKFPIQQFQQTGFHTRTLLTFIFLLFLTAYHFCYSLSAFKKEVSFRNNVKSINLYLALGLALVYLLITFPFPHLGNS